jgi:hypothetical protein
MDDAHAEVSPRRTFATGEKSPDGLVSRTVIHDFAIP